MDGASTYQKLFPKKVIQIDFQIVDRPQFLAEILRFNQIVRADKLLMWIAPMWMALASLGGRSGSQYYDMVNHQLGVAVPLRWYGDTQRTNSVMGRGTWVVSRHTQTYA
jgi:hypothetical protein